jgi:hypothetical protein
MHMHRSGTRKKDGAIQACLLQKSKEDRFGCDMHPVLTNLLFNISQTNSFNGDQEERGTIIIII